MSAVEAMARIRRLRRALDREAGRHAARPEADRTAADWPLDAPALPAAPRDYAEEEFPRTPWFTRTEKVFIASMAMLAAVSIWIGLTCGGGHG